MDIAKELATYIANAGYGTLGTSIFVGQMPESTDGLFIIRGGGYLNAYVPIEETVLDIYSKNTSSETAILSLESVKRLLHRSNTLNVNNAFMYSVLVIGDIDDVARDTEYEKIYKITVQIIHRDKGLIS